MKMNRSHCRLEIKSAEPQAEDGLMSFSGYGAVFGNVDAYGDVIEKGAFRKTIEEFKASVDGGAEFSAGNEENPEDSPLIYFPDNGNLTFSGRIRNIKWQFVLKDESGEGCYIWTDKLQLTHANMQVLNKLQGFFENWRANWQKEGASLEKLKNI